MKIYDLNELGIINKDERGWMTAKLAEFATEQGCEIKNIHIGTIEPGQIRGNHLHKKQKEWLFIFGGDATLTWKENEKLISREITIADKLLFEIEKSCPHAIKNTDKREIYVLAFADLAYDKNQPDRFFEKLIN